MNILKNYFGLIVIIIMAAFLFIQCPAAIKDNEDEGGASASTASSSSSSSSSESYTAVPLIKTNQTDSYGTGSDGDLEIGTAWPSPRFSSNTANTMIDNLTGLIWQKILSTVQRNWAGALTYANDATVDGFTDWRLPNINEMESTVNSGVRYAEGTNATWLNTQGFSNVQGYSYWTGTTYAADTTCAWYMEQSANSRMGKVVKTASSFMFAWLVRGNASNLVKTGQTVSYSAGDDGDLEQGLAWPAGSRFTVTGNTVKDNITGLVWLKSPDTATRTWANALTYANDLSTDLYTDWRLPNKKELRSLFNYGETNMASYLTSANFTNIQAQYYWTSTYYESSGGDKSFIVDFGNVATIGIGAVINNTWSNPAYVIAVRGGN